MLEQNLTKEDYKKIIEDLFKTFGEDVDETIKNLNNNISINNDNNILKNLCYKKTLNIILINNNIILNKKLNLFIDNLNENNLTNNLIEKQIKENKYILNNILKDIYKNYNNDFIFYLVFKEFSNIFKEDLKIFKNKEFKKCLKFISLYYSEKIKEKFKLNIDNINNRNIIITNILKSLVSDCSTSSLEFLRNNDEIKYIIKNLTYKNNEKWINTNYKKIDIMRKNEDKILINLLNKIIDKEEIFNLN